MKVLVLGGAGYIGSVLCSYLEEKNDTVIVVDNLLYEKNGRHVHNSNFIKGDICDINIMLPALEKVDAVVNLAAISNDPASDLRPDLTWKINYLSNEMIAKLCTGTKKRVVYASSCSVYGFSENGVFSENSTLGPVTLYAQTKMLSERFYIQKDVDSIILRFATVYGASPKPRFDLVVNTMIGTSFFKGNIVVNGGNQWRPIVHVKDVAKAIYLALHEKKPKHKIYNVGSNEQNYQITDLAHSIAKELPHVSVIHNKESKDGRSYKVDFKRIKKELSFKADFTIKDAIDEFYYSFNDKSIKNMEDDVYYRVKYLKNHTYNEKLIHKIKERIFDLRGAVNF